MRRLLLLIFLVCLAVFAGTTGKIVGKVYDKDTKSGLPGVNVIIEGTTMGAATDVDGYFVILNVPAGKYNVKASMIGYQDYTIKDVVVIADLTVTLEFPLTQAVIELEKGVEVVAKEPVIRKDVTQSMAVVDEKTMTQLPINTVQGAVLQTPGVVATDQIHFRGGRATEVVYILDGVELRDPYTGGFDSHIPQISVQETSVLTGGFGAEYGSAQSGVINVVTKEIPKLSMNVKLRTSDMFGVERLQNFVDKNYKWDYRWQTYKTSTGQTDSFIADSILDARQEKMKRLDFLLSTPIIPKRAFFLVSGELSNTYGHFANADDELYSYNNKLTIYVTPTLKFNISGLYTRRNYNVYAASWKFNLKNLYSPKEMTYSYAFNLSHAITPTTYWEFKLNNYTTEQKWDIFEDGSYDRNRDGILNSTYSPIDTFKVNPITLDTIWFTAYPDADSIDDFSDSDNDRKVEINGTETDWYWPELANYPYKRTGDQNGFVTKGYYRLCYHYDIKKTWTAKADFISQVTREHQFKTGIEMKYYDLFNYMADMASGGNVYMTYVSSYPSSYAAYIQDKMEFKDFVVNAGLRFDLFNPNGYVPKDPYNPVTDPSSGGEIKDPVKTSLKWKLSPRLGFSFPITEYDVLHFTYGHYFQVPPLTFLYTNKNWDFSGAFPMVGNPDIDAERTIAYEVGLKHAFSEYIKMDVNAYMKDITGLTDTKRYFYTPTNYYTIYSNADYGTAKGIEVALNKVAGGSGFLAPLTLSISYSFGIARGKSSSTRQNYDYIWAGYVVPQEEHYLDWDQRHTLNFGIGLDFGNFALNFLTDYGSGIPWTPPSRSRVQRINEDRLPYTINTDMRTYYYFNIGKVSMGAFFDVYNLFDVLNINSLADESWYNAKKAYDNDHDGYVGKDENHDGINDNGLSEDHDDLVLAAMGSYRDPTVISPRRFMRIGIEFRF